MTFHKDKSSKSPKDEIDELRDKAHKAFDSLPGSVQVLPSQHRIIDGLGWTSGVETPSCVFILYNDETSQYVLAHYPQYEDIPKKISNILDIFEATRAELIGGNKSVFDSIKRIFFGREIKITASFLNTEDVEHIDDSLIMMSVFRDPKANKTYVHSAVLPDSKIEITGKHILLEQPFSEDKPGEAITILTSSNPRVKEHLRELKVLTASYREDTIQDDIVVEDLEGENKTIKGKSEEDKKSKNEEDEIGEEIEKRAATDSSRFRFTSGQSPTDISSAPTKESDTPRKRR